MDFAVIISTSEPLKTYKSQLLVENCLPLVNCLNMSEAVSVLLSLLINLIYAKSHAHFVLQSSSDSLKLKSNNSTPLPLSCNLPFCLLIVQILCLSAPGKVNSSFVILLHQPIVYVGGSLNFMFIPGPSSKFNFTNLTHSRSPFPNTESVWTCSG